MISAIAFERASSRARLVLSLAVLAVLLALVSGPVALGAELPSSTGPQDVSLRLDRVFATDNVKLDIDGVDDKRVDVDIAVLDSGIKLDHPDVNIAGRTNCTAASRPGYQCTNASPGDGDDNEAGIWHGTNSAVDIAGIDNGIGRVGIAAGARLWSVDIHGDDAWNPGSPATNPINWDLESTIAGVKWVTDHANEIEVAHLIFGCAPEQVEALPQPKCLPDLENADLVDELVVALEDALDEGVIFIVGSGNWAENTNTLIPQREIDDLFVVSALTDTDGQPGGFGPAGCYSERDQATKPDDTSTGSNWGPLVDVTASGCAGSGAAPHVTAAAAVLASKRVMDTRSDVQEIAAAIFGDGDCAGTPANVGAANCQWTDTSNGGNDVKEPLLDVHDEVLFNPATTVGTVVKPGWDHDLKKRCVKSMDPAGANYHQDTTQCASDAKRWTAFVKADNATTQTGCPGPANQAFAINTSGSPAIMDWYQHWGSPLGPNWTVNLKVDNVYSPQPCMGPDSLTHLGLLDHINYGGGPLANPRSLISSHQMAYTEWRPNGGATRLVAAAMFRWAGKARWVEVNLHSAGFPDNHSDPEVIQVDHPSVGPERVVYDGPAIGRSVPNDLTTTTHWIDWKQLAKHAADEGWFTTPMTTNAETLGIHIGVQVKGDALATLWTTNFRTAGK